MRNSTQIQSRLIELGYPVGPAGADGTFGADSLLAYNRFLADKDRPPVLHPTIEQLNRDLFPEDVPAPKPKPAKRNLIQDILTGIVLNKLKDLPMLNVLTGQKTIITGIIMVVVGVASLLAPLIGLSAVPGIDLLTPGEAWTSLTTGFGLIFLRNAISNPNP